MVCINCDRYVKEYNRLLGRYGQMKESRDRLVKEMSRKSDDVVAPQVERENPPELEKISAALRIPRSRASLLFALWNLPERADTRVLLHKLIAFGSDARRPEYVTVLMSMIHKDYPGVADVKKPYGYKLTENGRALLAAILNPTPDWEI